MTAHWHFLPTVPFISQGKDTTRPNFSREERSEVGILIREGLQNALDAKSASNKGAVRVTFNQVQPDSTLRKLLDSFFTSEFRSHLKRANDFDLPDVGKATVLLIEDFGTKGLRGVTEDQDVDGPGENWNAFWHREGEGAKDKASNGGAGQGKITYYAHSYASTIFGVTVRDEDKAKLMMGRAALSRDYHYDDGKKYYRLAYWTRSKAAPLPENDTQRIASFAKAFGFKRLDESGLSLAIPFARPFETQEALACVILDFYMPIADGRLEVEINGLRIASDTIDELCAEYVSDETVRASGSSFSEGYRAFARKLLENSVVDATLAPEWNRERRIPEAAIAIGNIETLREKLAAGSAVGIELPLLIKKKTGQSFQTTFKVFLQTPENLDHNEEAFVRQDLLIGGEGRGTAGSLVQKTRSLTWITDQNLSDFLLAAEEPTHLKWNASLARDKALYATPELHLRSIRQAVPRLVALLLGVSGSKDFRALAKYFAKPKQEGDKSEKGAKTKSETGKNRESFEPPKRQRKPFQIHPAGAGIRLTPSGSEKLTKEELPFEALLELAYEGLDQDPFSAYDPFDFDLADGGAYPVSIRGLSVTERKHNRLGLRVADTDFELRIAGFDKHVKLRARLTYELPLQVDGSGGEIASEEDSDG
ncbi:MAG: hypothetical protein A3E01_00605 [Gammaproteobacteria bacterium RIFCSPHIGHO2_12_FULL_63_22]|nr:MAG: hypothetical protein A3E01_00605 [Gammaproteobacteria bacterium RIFCSPHIGHO2_12_FULL_63_22]